MSIFCEDVNFSLLSEFAWGLFYDNWGFFVFNDEDFDGNLENFDESKHPLEY